MTLTNSCQSQKAEEVGAGAQGCAWEAPAHFVAEVCSATNDATRYLACETGWTFCDLVIAAWTYSDNNIGKKI